MQLPLVLIISLFALSSATAKPVDLNGSPKRELEFGAPVSNPPAEETPTDPVEEKPRTCPPAVEPSPGPNGDPNGVVLSCGASEFTVGETKFQFDTVYAFIQMVTKQHACELKATIDGKDIWFPKKLNEAGDAYIDNSGYMLSDDSTYSTPVCLTPWKTHNLTLSDSYGDGWNGATLDIILTESYRKNGRKRAGATGIAELATVGDFVILAPVTLESGDSKTVEFEFDERRLGNNGVRLSQESHVCKDDETYTDLQFGSTCAQWAAWIKEDPATRSCRDPDYQRVGRYKNPPVNDTYRTGWVELESYCPVACGCGEGNCAFVANTYQQELSTAPCGWFECQSYLKRQDMYDPFSTGDTVRNWEQCCDGNMPYVSRYQAYEEDLFYPEVKKACDDNRTDFAELLEQHGGDCRLVAKHCGDRMKMGPTSGDGYKCRMLTFPPIWGKSHICPAEFDKRKVGYAKCPCPENEPECPQFTRKFNHAVTNNPITVTNVCNADRDRCDECQEPCSSCAKDD